MLECLQQFYGFVTDQLPYESREGGYQGRTWDTYDLLYDVLELDLPRDRDDRLRSRLPNEISIEVWCKYDWLSLDYNEELDHAWRTFCRVIQYERRFFFAVRREEPVDGQAEGLRRREEFPPLGLLAEIVELAEDFEMVRTLSADTAFFRCRPCDSDVLYTTARKLGPPPQERAIQANRMNPPGIPMMYGAETEEIAILETRSPHVSVGRFRFARNVRILDLADLPRIPGIFSGVGRRTRLGFVDILD